MPLRDAPTPDSAELDALAAVTPADLRRAQGMWMRVVGLSPRRALRTLLDATTENAGPASGPMSDEVETAHP